MTKRKTFEAVTENLIAELRLTGFKLEPKIKAQYVKALRSDKYVQGRKRLLNPGGSRCCLGVYDAEFCGGWHKNELYLRKLDSRHDFEILPEWVQRTLATANDKFRLTFLQIADAIEVAL